MVVVDDSSNVDSTVDTARSWPLDNAARLELQVTTTIISQIIPILSPSSILVRTSARLGSGKHKF